MAANQFRIGPDAASGLKTRRAPRSTTGSSKICPTLPMQRGDECGVRDFYWLRVEGYNLTTHALRLDPTFEVGLRLNQPAHFKHEDAARNRLICSEPGAMLAVQVGCRSLISLINSTCSTHFPRHTKTCHGQSGNLYFSGIGFGIK